VQVLAADESRVAGTKISTTRCKRAQPRGREVQAGPSVSASRRVLQMANDYDKEVYNGTSGA